jgi:hypothetical protein
MNMKINWDALGISASLACAIHCALLPLFFTSLPILGVELIDNTSFETVMIVAAFAIGSFSLYHGYRKHHHKALPLVIFVFGMLLLFAKQLWHQYQFRLLIPAVICIVTAHYINFRYCKKANHCHAHDCAH